MEEIVNKYQCHAFNDDLPNGRGSASLEVSESALTIDIGGQKIKLPLSAIELKMGGANNRLIFISHPRFPQWTFYTSDRRFLKDNYLLDSPAGRVLKHAKNHHRRAWLVLAAVAFIVVATPVFLILRMDIATELVAERIPVEWEQKLGESTAAQFKISQEMMPEEQADALLAPLVAPLLEARETQRYQYNFNIVNNSTINAFALPGGEIVIHSALILAADDAEELLGVLAHEMIHVEEQHGLRNVIGAAGIYVIAGAIFGDVSGILAVVSSAAPVLLNQSYSRRFEREADKLGFSLLERANINPAGLASFFKKLKQKEEKQLEEIENENTREVVQDVMAFMSTHPATDERIERLTDLLEGVKSTDNYITLSKEFTTLKMAVKDFTEVQNDKSENDRQSATQSTQKEDITHEN